MALTALVPAATSSARLGRVLPAQGARVVLGPELGEGRLGVERPRRPGAGGVGQPGAACADVAPGAVGGRHATPEPDMADAEPTAPAPQGTRHRPDPLACYPLHAPPSAAATAGTAHDPCEVG